MTTTGASKYAASGPIGAHSLGSAQAKRKRKPTQSGYKHLERVEQLEEMLKDSHRECGQLRKEVEELKEALNQPLRARHQDLLKQCERYKRETEEANSEARRLHEQAGVLKRHNYALLNALREMQGLPPL